MQKLRIKIQSNCIRSDTIHLGHPAIKRPPVQNICKSKTRNRGNSKLLGRIEIIVFDVPFSYKLPFSKLFKDPWSHVIGRPPFNSSNLCLCPFIWNSRLFYLHNFLYFLWQYLKQKFQNAHFFSFWKVWTTNTLSLNSWVGEAYINIRLENSYISEEKHD